MPRNGELVARVRERVVDELRSAPGASVPDLAHRHARAAAPLASDDELEAIVAAVVAFVRGLGPLEPLLADPSITDVMVVAGRSVWVERQGELELVDIELGDGEAELLIERVVAPLGRRVDRSSPIVDARLADGSRAHAIVPPLAVDGACLTIRRFGAQPVPLEAFGAPPVIALIAEALEARANLLVVGGTSSGKTTFLNALGQRLPPDERIITIEDAVELRLPGRHVVRLEARPRSADGVGEVTMRDLVRAALRMRPDRLVIGEVRGPEAFDLVAAMNIGHDGCLATCHANGPHDALRRLEALVLLAGSGLPHLAIREQLGASIDVIVHVVKTNAGRREVHTVAEVLDDGTGVRVVAQDGERRGALSRMARS